VFEKDNVKYVTCLVWHSVTYHGAWILCLSGFVVGSSGFFCLSFAPCFYEAALIAALRYSYPWKDDF
jgi:hypothetical protein